MPHTVALFIMYGALDFLVGNPHCKHNQNYSGSSLSNNLLHSDFCTKGLRPFSAALIGAAQHTQHLNL
jgi:hypothetical protein